MTGLAVLSTAGSACAPPPERSTGPSQPVADAAQQESTAAAQAAGAATAVSEEVATEGMLSGPESVAAVAAMLEGAMDSSQQAATQPSYYDVRITNCELQAEGAFAPDVAALMAAPGARLMYQEQAISASLSQPYRQRFLILRPGRGHEAVDSMVIEPEDKADLVGMCDRPKAERRVAATRVAMPMCQVHLKRSQERYFIGATPPGGCPNTFRGATRVSNQTVLSSAGMVSWDRGWDDHGRQLWGAIEGPYHFRRLHQASQAEAEAGPDPRVLTQRRLAALLIGRFDGRLRAGRAPGRPAVTQEVCEVDIAPGDAERFADQHVLGFELRPNRPGNGRYRQRILAIQAAGDGSGAVVTRYAPPEGAIIPDLCRVAREGRRVTADQMGTAVCTVRYAAGVNGDFVATPDAGCADRADDFDMTAGPHALSSQGVDPAPGSSGPRARQLALRHAPDADLDEIARRLTGKLDTAAQAAADERYMTVRYNNCPVTVRGNTFPAGHRMLLAEQTLSSPRFSFVRRRLLRIHRTDGGNTLVTDFRGLVDEDRFENFCDQPQDAWVIDSADIGETECGVFFHRQGDAYVGTTRACESNFQGATHLIINGRLDPDGLAIWERWYDQFGKQVAGATHGPYRYRRSKP